MNRIWFVVTTVAALACGGSSNGGTAGTDAGTNTTTPTQPAAADGGQDQTPPIVVNVPPSTPSSDGGATSGPTVTVTAADGGGGANPNPPAVEPPTPPQPPSPPEPPKPSCNVGEQLCGSTCSNPQTDYYNCGACGRTCGTGDMCIDAKCVNVCPTPPKNWLCGAITSPTRYCADLTSDTANCGGCGLTCGTGQNCKDAACVAVPPPTCDTGQTLCGSTCVEVTIDVNNCGACGVACAADQTCSAGHCAAKTPTCATGQTYCASSSIYTGRPPGCYDLHNTWDLCGSCDAFPCSQSWLGSGHMPGRCDDGVCAKSPPTCGTSGLTWCPVSINYPGRRQPNGACVDLGTDVQNCGTCDNSCGASQTCTNGTCVTPPPSCPTGQMWCGYNPASMSVSGCVDLLSDFYNCGVCGTFCHSMLYGAGQCVAGKCVFPP